MNTITIIRDVNFDYVNCLSKDSCKLILPRVNLGQCNSHLDTEADPLIGYNRVHRYNNKFH